MYRSEKNVQLAYYILSNHLSWEINWFVVQTITDIRCGESENNGDDGGGGDSK